jgi:uncharacterized protein (TIGR00730 family)
MGLKRVCVFCGASPGASPRYAEIAGKLGAALARAGVGLVYGGGAAGIMGALSDAALAAGGEVTGVIPKFLMARELGRTDLKDLRVVGSMHEGKQLMHDLSSGFIALPGGLGTMEELFEAVTWSQLGLHRKPIILLNTESYFSPLAELLDHALAEGFITRHDRALMRITTRPDEAIDLALARNCGA